MLVFIEEVSNEQFPCLVVIVSKMSGRLRREMVVEKFFAGPDTKAVGENLRIKAKEYATDLADMIGADFEGER